MTRHFAQQGRSNMFRALRYLLILAFLSVLGLIGFAYFGDLSPQRQETRQPVTLNGD